MRQIFLIGSLLFLSFYGYSQEAEQVTLAGITYVSEDTISISTLQGAGNEFFILPETQGSGWFFQVLTAEGEVLVEEEIESTKVSARKIKNRAERYGRAFFINENRRLVLHFSE